MLEKNKPHRRNKTEVDAKKIIKDETIDTEFGKNLNPRSLDVGKVMVSDKKDDSLEFIPDFRDTKINGVLPDPVLYIDRPNVTIYNKEVNSIRDAMIKDIVIQQSVTFPPSKILIILGSFLISFAISLIIGSNLMDSIVGLQRCSTLFYVTLVFYFLCVLGLWICSFIIIKNETKTQAMVRDPWPFPEVVIWNKKNLVLFSVFAIIVGLIGTMIQLNTLVFIIPL